MEKKQYLIEVYESSVCNKVYIVTAKNSYEAITKYIKKEYSQCKIGEILCKAENLTVDELIALHNNTLPYKIRLLVHLGTFGIMNIPKDTPVKKIEEEE
jgi:hypothetical protein